MKKYISVILVLVMACSLMYAIPAQAASTVGEVNVSENFESISDVSIYGAGTTLNDAIGANSTSKSMNVIEADAASEIEFAITEPVLGRAYTFEAWIKVNGADSNKIHWTFNGKDAVVKNGTNQVAQLKKDTEIACELTQDTWTHVKTNIIWNGQWDGLTGTVLDVDAYTVSLNVGDNEALTYDIDEIKISTPTAYKKLDSNYPYIAKTYDAEIDAVTGVVASRAEVGWGSASVSSTGGSQLYYHYGEVDTAANYSIAVPYVKVFTDKYRVSAYLKLDTEKTTNPANVNAEEVFYLNKTSGTGPSGGNLPNMSSIRDTLDNFSDGNWVKFEMIMDGVDIGTVTAAEFIPRLGSGNGNVGGVFPGVDLSVAPAPYAYYLDDFVVEPYIESTATGVPKLEYVESEDVECYNLVGSYFRMGYKYNPVAGAVESKVRVRVLQEFGTGEYAIIDQFYGDLNGFVYEIPESANGYKLKFEVMPYDLTEDGDYIAGYQTEYVTTDAITDVSESVEVHLNNFDSDNKKIDGTVIVTNKSISGDKLNLFAMVALYNENGALLRIVPTPISIANGDDGTVETFTATFADIYDNVKTAKVFVWGGEDLAVTNRKAYTAVEEKTK